jgi:hypothetical protein
MNQKVEREKENEKLEFEEYSNLIKELQSLSSIELEKRVKELEKLYHQLQWEV